MSLFFVEIFLCFAICFILFRCCGRILVLQQQQQLQHQLSEQHQQQQGMGDGNNELDDLRRFRERLSQARGGEGGRSRVSASSPDTISESALAARKELIHQNLFFRQINREESVKELSRLLAISRGGDGATIVEEDDEELGRVPVKESSSNTAVELREESNGEVRGNELSNVEMNAPSPHTAPAPSAPPLPAVEDAPTAETPTVDARKVTTAVSRLWSSFSRRQLSEISSNDDTTVHHHHQQQQQHQQRQHHQANNENISRISLHHNSHQLSSSTSLHHLNKIECSICLEQYSPNDVIAWAKDGGDAPPNSSTCTTPSSYNTGCDHIFHRECLVAWLLQDHDECPLCRRRVIHADADIRFAGWEER